MSIIQKLKDMVIAAEADAIAFHQKGNVTAGRRLRKSYQQIKILAQEGRAEVMELKKKKLNDAN